MENDEVSEVHPIKQFQNHSNNNNNKEDDQKFL